MPLIEVLTTSLGAALAKTTAKLWFRKMPYSEAIADELVDVLRQQIDDFETRRATQRLFEKLEDELASRLAGVIDVEFPNLAENERNAAALAVADVFDQLELDQTVSAVDLDATRLEAAMRPVAAKIFGSLGQSGESLANLLLREACNYVVALATKLPNFQVTATRELLKRDRELLEDLKKVLDIVVAMRTEALHEDAREAQGFELQYRRTLVRRLDRLELFGLRLIGAGAREYGLTVAYVSLTATVSGPPEPQRVEDALSGVQRIVIRGEAGSGKTTLLQWLAVRAASRDSVEPLATLNQRIPFYVRLRDYADHELPRPADLIEGVARNVKDLMPNGWAQEVLSKRAIVIVDGIDELPIVRRRRDFLPWLRDLLSDFPEAIFVLSSRPAALEADTNMLGKRLTDHGFKMLTLEPMTLADSEALVAQWHAAVARDITDESKREKLAVYERDLRQSLRNRNSIRSLASNPLLCSMLCALNWDRQQRLPDDRMELYRLAHEMFLEARDDERGVRPVLVQLARSEKEELLDGLAYWMMRNGYSEAPREDAEQQIERTVPRLGRLDAKPAEILDELLERSGLLLQPERGVIAFVHRTFLEYLAARGAIRLGDFGVLVERAKQESWRETVVFAAGHAQGQARDQLINGLLKKSWLQARPVEAEVTAICCLETVGRSIDPILLDRLRDLVRGLFPPHDSLTAQFLAPAAAMEPGLLVGHAQRGESAVGACIRSASIIGGRQMLEIIATYATVAGDIVDFEIARAWDAFDDDAFLDSVVRPRGRIFGMDCADFDSEAFACLRLLVAFGQHRRQRPKETLVTLLYEFRKKHSLAISGGGDWDPGPSLEGNRSNRSALASALNLKKRKPADVIARGDVARHLMRLGSAEKLALPFVEPQVVPALSRLSKLQELRFGIAVPTDLAPLGELQLLERVYLVGRGVVDARPLSSCAQLKAVELLDCAISDPTHLPLPPRLLDMRLQFLEQLDSLEQICAASHLQTLLLRGIKAPIGGWLISFPELVELTISGCPRVTRLPFGELKHLTNVFLTGVPPSALDQLERSPSVKWLKISDIQQFDMRNVGCLSTLQRLALVEVDHVTGIQALIDMPMLTNVTFVRCRGDFTRETLDTLRETLRNKNVNVDFGDE